MPPWLRAATPVPGAGRRARIEGKRRNIDWTALVGSASANYAWQSNIITRGFTGHEELDQVDLVHMNGRVYDPEIGRFLSPDIAIADITSSQAINAYTYVNNNPLSYTDPSGFFLKGLFHKIGKFFSRIGHSIGRLVRNGIFRAIVQIIACANPAAMVTCAPAAVGLTLAAGGSIKDALIAGALAFAQLPLPGGGGIWGAVGSAVAGSGTGLLGTIVTHAVIGGAFSLMQPVANDLHLRLALTRALRHTRMFGAGSCAYSGEMRLSVKQMPESDAVVTATPAAGKIAAPVEATGWLRTRGDPALSDVHRTIHVHHTGSMWRRLVGFLGPGYLVAVGYMDPGNWATSIAGGAQFGYTLLAVALISNIMAIILQSLAARLAIGSGRDLAQACRDGFPKAVSLPLWVLAEAAIIATDVAEVIGTAIGLKLLFGVPLAVGVLITALDVFLVLLLQRAGFRYLEAFVIAGLGIIALCFGAQLLLADPEWSAVFVGFIPKTEIVTNPEMLYLALGILGATVMPHNLYLHSAIVGTRDYGRSTEGRREALRFATIDSTVALMLALSINAAILILAAAAFNQSGRSDVADLTQAHDLLSPLLGSAFAPTLFAIALLACGLNSTVTATLAGQAVMEGFIEMRLQPWLRRLITRMIAIVPAAGVTIFAGEQATGKLLILSQVILSLQLPFAVVPLVLFTAQKSKLGALTAPRWLSAIAVVIAAVIIALNMKLIFDFVLGSGPPAAH